MRLAVTPPPWLLLLFICLATLDNQASAQGADQIPSARTRIVKANTLSLFAGGMTVFYEQAFAPATSFQLAVHSGAIEPWAALYTVRYRSLAPEMRFYLRSAQAPQGIYMGPYLKYQHLRRTYSDKSFNENSGGLGAGLTAGRQWVRRRGFVMDIFGGIGYYLVQSSFVHSVDPDGLDARLGFSLGYAF
jgi:hypothetical protein